MNIDKNENPYDVFSDTGHECNPRFWSFFLHRFLMDRLDECKKNGTSVNSIRDLLAESKIITHQLYGGTYEDDWLLLLRKKEGPLLVEQISYLIDEMIKCCIDNNN